jgi:chemotaxis protein methyltransferase CheR
VSTLASSMVLESRWAALSDYVSANLGLHFPPDRFKELRRGMEKAAFEYGYQDLDACIQWLLSQPPTQERLVVLARHLTIGETYFFRDLQALEVLSSEVLAPLVAARAQAGRYLRLWSAGCSSGEEAYTLAILLHRMVPEITQWNVTILATDINTQSLQKAEAATYGEWSFRSAPAWLKPGYFSRGLDGRYTVLPHIRRMVRFGFLNLAEPLSASRALDVQGMDVVLCRHVIMYFEAAQAPLAAGRLHASLVQGGWLVTSSCEASPQLFPGFDAVTHAGAVLMRRRDGAPTALPTWGLPEGRVPLEPGRYVIPAARDATRVPHASLSRNDAQALAPQVPPRARPVAALGAVGSRLPFGATAPVGRPAADANATATATTTATATATATVIARPAPPPADAAALPANDSPSAHVHALAGQGRWDEALRYCDQRLAANKLDATFHYLRAMVLVEMGQREAAEDALSKALYVDPDHALAHFAKGQLALTRQAKVVAQRHFRQVHALLARRPAEELIADADGMSAGALLNVLHTLLAEERGLQEGA